MDSVARVRFLWRDRDNSEGAVQWNVPSSTSFDDIYAMARSTAIPRIAALSNAEFDRLLVTYFNTINDPPQAPIGSDVRRKLMIWVENADGDIDVISIFSPVGDIFETSGPYAGIRVRPDAVADLMDMLTVLPFLTNDGRELGTTFLAGALAY